MSTRLDHDNTKHIDQVLTGIVKTVKTKATNSICKKQHVQELKRNDYYRRRHKFHTKSFSRTYLPYVRIFTPIQKQIKIENTDEILKYFKESKFYDCRISAFPFLENWYIKLHGPQPPDILFIDLDASQFKSGRALYLALVRTLKEYPRQIQL